MTITNLKRFHFGDGYLLPKFNKVLVGVTGYSKSEPISEFANKSTYWGLAKTHLLLTTKPPRQLPDVGNEIALADKNLLQGIGHSSERDTRDCDYPSWTCVQAQDK